MISRIIQYRVESIYSTAYFDFFAVLMFIKDSKYNLFYYLALKSYADMPPYKVLET